MITLVFFLEEKSAEALLKVLLPRFLPMQSLELRFIVFEGKQDLEKQLVRKMRHWKKPDSYFIVLRDQDSEDCKDVKKRLLELCQEANHPETLVRIACHEIESWYLGDLEAVEKGLDIRGIAQKQEKSKFREPDRLGNPSEELAKETEGVYQKISGSRAIGTILGEKNKSRSFYFFLTGVRDLVNDALAKS